MHKTLDPYFAGAISVHNICAKLESFMVMYGYARVSTDGQSLAAQIAELKSARCEKVFHEKISGARSDRKQLARLIAVLADTDASAMVAMSRFLSRNRFR